MQAETDHQATVNHVPNKKNRVFQALPIQDMWGKLSE